MALLTIKSGAVNKISFDDFFLFPILQLLPLASLWSSGVMMRFPNFFGGSAILAVPIMLASIMFFVIGPACLVAASGPMGELIHIWRTPQLLKTLLIFFCVLVAFASAFGIWYLRLGLSESWGTCLDFSIRQLLGLGDFSRPTTNESLAAAIRYQAVSKWVVVIITGAFTGRLLQNAKTSATPRTFFTAAVSFILLASTAASAFANIYFCNVIWGGFDKPMNLSTCLQLAFMELIGKSFGQYVAANPFYQTVVVCNSLFGLFLALIASKVVLTFRSFPGGEDVRSAGKAATLQKT